MTTPIRFACLAAAAVLFGAGPAFAHLGGLPAGPAPGFFAGFAHPLGGADHILAMGAVGVLASAGGARLWLYPALFIAAMAAGFAIAGAGIALPWAELGIAGSLVALGLAIVFTDRLPLLAAAALIALCAVLHGHAHGTEAVNLASPFVYAGGFALATALLHTAGVALGFALRRWRMISTAGYGLAAAGALFVAGL